MSGGALGTQRFVYDGNALIAEYNSAGTMLRRYVHGSNVEADDPLIWYEGSAVSNTTRRYLHADPRGSIVAVTNYQGTATATNSYDEYGIPDSASGNDISTKGRFRYTGQAWIPELGMYYYKARIYSPTLGRFLQTDPIGYEDQFNLYAYVGNDPINSVDPDGEALETLWDAANVVAGVASAASNISEGNWGAAAVDAGGVLVDAAATVVPGVPGGAAAGIKLVRAADKVGDASKGGKAAKAAGERARNNAKGVPNSRLGPSGKPKQHTVRHSTRKSAQQAAKKEADRAGGKVRNDANPANPKQKPHFQAEDAKGKNVKPVVHHERPD